MVRSISLRDMLPGEKGKISRITAEGEINQRIRNMGLIPGASISVVGKAPLRDPMAVRLDGVTISLRNNEADYVTVDIEPDA